jgi:DNA-binding transcriptional LysR family regulator
MEPEARLLRYFLAVAEALNFTRAAETIGIAQPALSAQIRQLEGQLGVQLLNRTTRSVELTEAGRAVQELGPGALASLAEVWEAARRAGRGETGRLRLAYTASAGYDTAPQLVQALGERYPAIDVTTEVLPSVDLVRAVRDGAMEAGVARMPEALSGVRLRTVRLDLQGALVADGHPLAVRDAVELAEVAEHPIVIHPRAANPAHFDFIEDLFRRAGLVARFVERAVAFDPTQRLVRTGRAISVVGESAVDGLAAGLRWVPFADSVQLPVQLVLRAGEPTGVADRFERVAIAHAASVGWLDDPGSA